MNEKIYIMAGSYKQYVDYCTAKGLNPKEHIYANRIEKVQGVREANMILTGTYMKPKDSLMILDVAKARSFHIKRDDY